MKRCGDGTIDPGETCDAGKNNKSPGTPGASCACSQDDPSCTRSFNVSWANSCLWARCGDGIVNNLAVYQGKAVDYELVHEECDDGPSNGVPGNSCSKTCQLVLAQAAPVAFCGNGLVEPGELCDQGLFNGKPGSRCTADCTFADGRAIAAGGDFVPPALHVDNGGSIDLPLLPGQYGTARPGSVDASVTTIATTNPPAGKTGPASIAIMAMGAAAGWAWVRRRRVARS